MQRNNRVTLKTIYDIGERDRLIDVTKKTLKRLAKTYATQRQRQANRAPYTNRNRDTVILGLEYPESLIQVIIFIET